MPTYTQLTNDEKAAIKQASIRSLEYQMYALEVEVLVENAKSAPDAERLSDLESSISEKQTQIAAL
jgi:hypothetical protein